MKISYNWLKEFLDFRQSPDELAQLLTDAGLEVEHLENWQSIQGGLDGVVIGKVLTCEKHPNADRLHVTTVDTGDGQVRQIVCGAPNVAAGQTVIVALPGAKLYPSQGEPFEIKKSKIRGEVSEGMICAEDEIGCGESHAGIMVLDNALPAGLPAATYFEVVKDVVLEIGLTPNRADAASHLGVARDIRAVLSVEEELSLRMPDTNAFLAPSTEGEIKVVVDNASDCIRYSGVELKDVKVGESPLWLRNKLKAIGIRSINNVVDVTNLVMFELGQPLHAFDADTIHGKTIRVGKLPAGTHFKTLDGVERELQGTELMIADEKGGLCIAGVFGGHASGVTAATTRLFLESACFHTVAVRKSARQHGLHTDSSFRFERGTDPEMTMTALKRAALLIAALTGASVCSKPLDIYPVPVAPRKVNLSFSYLRTIIGDEIPRQLVLGILEKLDIHVEEDQSDWLVLSVPAYRIDVTREADVAEEILRIYGYNKVDLPRKFSITPGFSRNPDPEEIIERAGAILVAHGFREILTNSLTKLKYAETLPCREGAVPVEVLNPLSGDLALMRHHMLFTGLEAVAYNINRKQKDLRFFELGKTYLRNDGKYVEEQHLCLWLTGQAHPEHWRSKAKVYDMFGMKAFLDNLLSGIGVDVRHQLSMKQEQENGLEDSIQYFAGKKEILVAGQVSRKVLKELDIDQPVWFADIRTAALLKILGRTAMEVAGPPRYPEVRRDLSLMLDRQVAYEALEKLAYSAEPVLLRQVNVFDVYEGDKIEAGKKSYALSFILRDDEATLQDKQIDAVMDKLMKKFEQQLGAVIRKG